MSTPSRKKPRATRRRSKSVLDDYLPYQIRLLSEAYSLGLARELQRRFDLPLREWRILFLIGAEEPMTVTQIAVRTVIDKGSVSRALANLTEWGYVRRRNAGATTRRATFHLNAKGWRVYRAVEPLLLAREKRLLEPLSQAERKQLLRSVKKLLPQVWAANAGAVDLYGDGSG